MSKDIFQPRKMEERLSKFPIKEGKMLRGFQEGIKIKVYLNIYKRFVEAKVLGGLETDMQNKWCALCNLKIKSDYVDQDEWYGTYRTTARWDKRKECWRVMDLDGGWWVRFYTKK